MRVLHINSTIVINSGVMSVLMNYYRHLDRDKVQFDYLYFMKSSINSKTYEDSINALGGKVYYIDNFVNLFSFNRELASLLRHNNYHTVHIHDPFVVKLIYKTLKNNGVINIIVHSHATEWSEKKLSSIRNELLCFNIENKANYLFACSNAAGRFLFGNNPFIIMNNAIETDKYAFDSLKRSEMRERLGLSNNIVFGHVGNFCAQKNHHFLINVFKEIINLDNSAKLILIGDGDLFAETKEYINRLSLEDNVLLLGRKYNVEEYYQVMDCMILPSLYEGLPVVGVEAQCSGLPVLFSDSITQEVGMDYSSYCSLDEDYVTWAKKAIALVNKNFDRTIGRQTVIDHGFDIEIEALKLQKFYLSIDEE